MSNPVLPFFGVSNRSMYTVPVGPVASGLRQLRGIQRAANKAAVTPIPIGPKRYPNGKKVKAVN